MCFYDSSQMKCGCSSEVCFFFLFVGSKDINMFVSSCIYVYSVLAGIMRGSWFQVTPSSAPVVHHEVLRSIILRSIFLLVSGITQQYTGCAARIRGATDFKKRKNESRTRSLLPSSPSMPDPSHRLASSPSTGGVRNST